MAVTNTRRSLIILRCSVPGQISMRASVGRYTRFIGRYWKSVTPLERRPGAIHASQRADHIGVELEICGVVSFIIEKRTDINNMLYDRTSAEVTLDEVDRLLIYSFG